jgi:hypothetical protein
MMNAGKSWCAVTNFHKACDGNAKSILRGLVVGWVGYLSSESGHMRSSMRSLNSASRGI